MKSFCKAARVPTEAKNLSVSHYICETVNSSYLPPLLLYFKKYNLWFILRSTLVKAQYLEKNHKTVAVFINSASF